MDLAFETCKDGNIAFGGVLIRSLIRRNHPLDPDGVGLIAGPLRCKDELLNGQGFAVIDNATSLKDIKSQLKSTTRQGINEGKFKDKPYRYFLPQKDNWKHTYIQSLVYSKNKETVLTDKSRTDTYTSIPK